MGKALIVRKTRPGCRSLNRRLDLAIAGAALSALLLPAIAHAQGAVSSSPPEFARDIEKLKPGEWVWAPEVAPSGPVLVYVDLSRQIAMVYRNGIRIAATTVSTGKPGHSTPTGIFTILQKDAKHRSSTYNNAPMPYQQRLTWDGVALHAGGLPGYPESHGCVHLPIGFARELFAITDLGGTVVVQGDAAHHVATSENSLLAPFDELGEPLAKLTLRSGERYRWNPELAPSGPLSIIVSKLDQRIVVLRSGVEIGRSVATIDDPDPGSHVATRIVEDGRAKWSFVGMTGHEDEEGKALDEAELNRIRMPREFHDLVMAAVEPGATMLITNSRVGSGPRPHLTLVDAVAHHE